MRKKVENLIGQKFGRITVIERAPDLYYPNKIYKSGFMKISMWKCVCDCDPNKFLIIRGTALKTGRTRSCGCIQKEKAANYCSANKKKYNKYDLTGKY